MRAAREGPVRQAEEAATAGRALRPAAGRQRDRSRRWCRHRSSRLRRGDDRLPDRRRGRRGRRRCCLQHRLRGRPKRCRGRRGVRQRRPLRRESLRGAGQELLRCRQPLRTGQAAAGETTGARQTRQATRRQTRHPRRRKTRHLRHTRQATDRGHGGRHRWLHRRPERRRPRCRRALCRPGRRHLRNSSLAAAGGLQIRTRNLRAFQSLRRSRGAGLTALAAFSGLYLESTTRPL
jgi:hypothetical protein